MKRSKIFLAFLVLGMIGLTALILTRAKSNQRLGEPGIKTRAIAGSKNLEILLPETLPGWTSEILTNAEAELLKLPADTSFRMRAYKAADDFLVQTTVVLMGSDRTSIHKPEICMTGQGWAMDAAASRLESVKMKRPIPYDLPVNKMVFTKMISDSTGRTVTVRGLFVYWFVDGNNITARRMDWMLWWLPRDLLLNGVLERWSYVSLFSYCEPGQEEATYERMTQFIGASVPEFQLVPKAGK